MLLETLLAGICIAANTCLASWLNPKEFIKKNMEIGLCSRAKTLLYTILHIYYITVYLGFY